MNDKTEAVNEEAEESRILEAGRVRPLVDCFAAAITIHYQTGHQPVPLERGFEVLNAVAIVAASVIQNINDRAALKFFLDILTEQMVESAQASATETKPEIH